MHLAMKSRVLTWFQLVCASEEVQIELIKVIFFIIKIKSNQIVMTYKLLMVFYPCLDKVVYFFMSAFYQGRYLKKNIFKYSLECISRSDKWYTH